MELQRSSELEAIIRKDYANMAGILVQHEGATIYEQYFNNCDETCRCHVFSVTKSILSILIGIAIDQGYIKDVHCNIIDFFPEYVIKRGEKTMQKITLEHMLTMTAPYKYKFAPYTKFFTSEDWVKTSLDLLGGKGKIGDFRYTPVIGPDILTGILAKVTGKSVLAFVKENLFEPLEIKTPSPFIFQSKEEQMAYYKTHYTDFWVADPKGVNTAAWGLSLSPRDMAKLGQLYLNLGKWKGRQLVSAEWIRQSTTEHSRWDKINLSYGYLWWLDSEGNGFAAIGDGGNVIYVNTKNRLVVAITSLFKPRVKDRIEFIKKEIEPRVAGSL